ncbi:cytoskeleton-associated protein 2 [Erinaceus europaeus]|uniref:Cytoskeleton-associated protein 2 n=1 Tax=Erinaceus europaeus TaxID=9365 RepID=A0A1S2ZMG0_ERIEU|nr:cytoskeleton-associated protein 2 [Erinaceus europaeus]
MSAAAVPRDLQLPPSHRADSAFREQRRQKLKEHLLKRKTLFSLNRENQVLPREDQRAMASEDKVQQETKVLKLKTKMADKENVNKHTGSKSNITLEKSCNPLTPSKELTNSTIAVDTHNLETKNQSLQMTPTKDDPQSQHMTLSKAFHLKNNNKTKQMTAEKPKQDVNLPKRPVLGSYRGQIVQSKVNSFRKPLPVKDDNSSIAKKLPATFSGAIKPQPVNNSVKISSRSDGVSHIRAATKSVSTTYQNKQLVRPPIRSHHDKNQDPVKHSTISRTTANVTVRKGPNEKESRLHASVSSIKTSSSQDVKINRTLSRNMTSEIVSRPPLSTNPKLIEKSKVVDQRRHTIAKATTDGRAAWPKETAEERKARLSEWRASKGRTLKKPPSSVVTHPEPAKQNEKPIGSFWTTMAEEDEQRLFTEKVNKTFSECLGLISEGCPREEILAILNDLIKEIPDAKKLVKYWICLARIEPITSPIENIFTIYEKAILTGAQPIEEMRYAIVDILAMKSQEKTKSGGNIEETCITKEQVQEVNNEDTGVNLDSGKPEVKNEVHKNVAFQDYEKAQDRDTTKDPGSDVKTPNTSTSCLIKYNVSTTPHLQSVKKKMHIDETNSTFKELKFLTPVRRSRRLQKNSSKLPDMLKDHYPCVSSLEELTELGNETDAFICRPNAALYPMVLDAEIAEEK